MTTSTFNTPLRRSNRGQPMVSAPSISALQLTDSTDALPTLALQTRRCSPHDLYTDELEGVVDAEIGSWETRSYTHFTRNAPPPVKRATKVYGKNRDGLQSNATSGGGETFRVGDTVLVKTQARNSSVAVIVAIWEVIAEGGMESKGMRVRLHWFIRPKELPTVRARRDSLENEVYYSLNNTIMLYPSNILSHCKVSSVPPTNKPVTRRRGLRAAEHGTSDFYCRFAINPLRGFFYQFDWDEFSAETLQAQVDPLGLGEGWNVLVAESANSGRSRNKTVSAEDNHTHTEPEIDVPATADDEDPLPPTPKTSSRKRKRTSTASATPIRTSQRKRRNEEEDDNISLPGLDAGASESSLDALEVQELIEESDDSADEYTQPEDEEEPDEEPDEDAEAEAEVEVEEVEEVLKTPSRRKRGSQTPGTPRTPHTPKTPRRTKAAKFAEPTPHSKAALRKRKRTALVVRPPLKTDAFDLRVDLEARLGPQDRNDPWLRAMHVLHVAARPEALPCREEEYGRVLRAVEELLEEGSGGCVYISGVPGTGKTATVHAVVRELKRMAEQSETNPFTYVEINGLRIPEPAAAYGLLWEAVSGHDAAQDGHMKISANQALKSLSRHFSSAEHIGPGGHACVVLMDELDQLMTTKQDVVYNFFNWPTLAGSKLVVLAVANTMDLPERVMTGRVRSRLGMIRINFQPYTTPQLEKIVKARLEAAKEGLTDSREVIAPDGIKFAAMKVSSISGDARRVLDICRRTVELVQPRHRTARTEDVNEVIKEMQNSPTAAYLRELSFHERLMLAALLKCMKKEGVEEIKWGDVQHQHIVYMNLLADHDDPARRPTPGELRLVLDSLLASHALISEGGAVAARKPEDERRVALNLEHMEVERVLGEAGGVKWKNALSV